MPLPSSLIVTNVTRGKIVNALFKIKDPSLPTLDRFGYTVGANSATHDTTALNGST